MKTTIKQLIDTASTVNKICNSRIKDIKVSYWFSKLHGKIVTEFNLYDVKRKELLAQYGKKDESGKFVMQKDEKGSDTEAVELQDGMKEVFAKEHEKLVSTEIEFDFDKKFTLENLGTIEPNLTPVDISSIMIFIDEVGA